MASITGEDIGTVESSAGGETNGGPEVNGTLTEASGKPYRMCSNLKVSI